MLAVWRWLSVLILGSTLSSSLLPLNVYDKFFLLFLQLSSSLKLFYTLHAYVFADFIDLSFSSLSSCCGKNSRNMPIALGGVTSNVAIARFLT